jgi:membrane fusion protein, multidrug efflux system
LIRNPKKQPYLFAASRAWRKKTNPLQPLHYAKRQARHPASPRNTQTGSTHMTTVEPLNTTPTPKQTSPPPKKRGWIWLIVLCLACVAGYFITVRMGLGKGQAPIAGKKSKGGGAVPVLVAPAKKGEMPVYLNGLGTITAFNTVTVRTRVDGQLVKIAFEEGQLVKEGDLLAEIDPRPYQVQLEQAEGQKARDEAQLKNAMVDLERYKVLLAQDSIPKQQLDTQTAAVHQFEGVIRSDEAAINNVKLQLFYSHITAPLTGRIGLRLVDQGNMVHASDANGLVVITQLQPIALIFNIPQDSLPQVLKKTRAGATLRVDAYDRDLKNKLAGGTLLTIDNQIDQTTGTVRFKAVFPNTDNSLFPNQFVNARLLVDTRHGAIIIPTAAIQRSTLSTFVYVVKPDNTVEARNIVTTITEADEAAVDSGLKAGEKVVIDGVDKLQPGTKVNAKTADAGAKS